jgi:molecular chaperone GrpE (heat shock protein)
MNEPFDDAAPTPAAAPESANAGPESGGAAAVDSLAQEIAEDMLNVLERLSAIERLVRDQARASEALRRDLVGAHRALAVRSVFDAVASALDSLESVRLGLGPDAPGRAHTQLGLAASVLNILLQTLGFERFDVVPGEQFLPDRMECLGYAEGEPGRVLEVVRAGYCTGELVVRPAGVLIADPAARNSRTGQQAEAAPESAAPPQEGQEGGV